MIWPDDALTRADIDASKLSGDSDAADMLIRTL